MYEVSSALAAALAEQVLQIRVTCGNTILSSDEVSGLRYSASCGAESAFSIGSVTSATVSMTVLGRCHWLDEIITVEVGAEVSGVVQYVPLGTFVVSECRIDEHNTELVGYDAAYYTMGGTYVPTVSEGATVAQVLGDIADQCGLTLATLPESATTTTVVGDDLTGRTLREMTGYMAGLIGMNAIINRDGELALKQQAYSDGFASADMYSNLSLGSNFRVGFVACTVPVRSVVETITSRVIKRGNGSTGVSFQNPYMGLSTLEQVWYLVGGTRLQTGSVSITGGMKQYSSSTSMIGSLLLEPGDMILLREPDGTSYRLGSTSVELSIDGGCLATISSQDMGGSETNANIASEIAEKFKEVNAQIVAIKSAL